MGSSVGITGSQSVRPWIMQEWHAKGQILNPCCIFAGRNKQLSAMNELHSLGKDTIKRQHASGKEKWPIN